MRRISAQYLFTSTGKPLKRGVVTVDDEGTIVAVEDTGGDLREKAGAVTPWRTDTCRWRTEAVYCRRARAARSTAP